MGTQQSRYVMGGSMGTQQSRYVMGYTEVTHSICILQFLFKGRHLEVHFVNFQYLLLYKKECNSCDTAVVCALSAAVMCVL